MLQSVSLSGRRGCRCHSGWNSFLIFSASRWAIFWRNSGIVLGLLLFWLVLVPGRGGSAASGSNCARISAVRYWMPFSSE